MAKKEGLMVVSGGVDSVTLMHEYKDEIAMAISFDYGSNHAPKELECAKYQCELLGIPHRIVKLDFVKGLFKSSLLEGPEAIPEGHYAADNMKSTVVPFRNGIMLSIAAGIAESQGLKRIYIANHFGDHDVYPDCREDFVTPMKAAISSGTYVHVELCAPYTNITKADIMARGVKLGVDYTKTWSCYKGGDKPCGKCGTCVEKIEAARANGIKLPEDEGQELPHNA